jgi:hypothetical protein
MDSIILFTMSDQETEKKGEIRPSLFAVISFLVFDICTILADIFLFGKLTASFESLFLPSYIFIYLFFCIAILLKRFDREYLEGLEDFGKRHAVISFFSTYMIGLGLGGMAVGSFITLFPASPVAVNVPLFIILPFLYPVLFGITTKKDTKRIPKMPGWLVIVNRLVTQFIFFSMSSYMLAFVYVNLAKIQKEGPQAAWVYPFLFLIIAGAVILFYLPARIHSFFQTPKSRFNTISFFVTCVSAAVFTITGVYL